MQSLDRHSQLLRNGIIDIIFAKSHGTVVLNSSYTLDMSIFRMGTVRLECTFAKPLTEIVAIISLNQVETYWENYPRL